MPINPGSTIILSHVHKDHWFRIADDPNAYECHWFIPDEQASAQLKHKFAEIIVHGGSVCIIDRDMDFLGGKITCASKSIINPTRAAKNLHESGKVGKTIAIHINIRIIGKLHYLYNVKQKRLQDARVM